MTTYAFDQPVTLRFSTFSDAAQTVPADPTTVEIDVLAPDGTETVATWAGTQVVRDSMGVFHYTFTPAQAGRYAFHWKAAGAIATSANGSFDVNAKYTVELISLSDAKAHLNIDDAVTKYDTELQGFIDAASAFIVRHAGPITLTTFTEVHSGGGPTIVVDNPPVVAVTSLTEYVAQSPYLLTQAELGTANVGQYSFSIDDAGAGIIARRFSGGLVGAFAAGYRNVSITYTAGTTTVPADVRMATLEDLRGLWTQTQYPRPDAQFGAGIGSPDSWNGSPTNPVGTFPRLMALLAGPTRTPSIA